MLLQLQEKIEEHFRGGWLLQFERHGVGGNSKHNRRPLEGQRTPGRMSVVVQLNQRLLLIFEAVNDRGRIRGMQRQEFKRVEHRRKDQCEFRGSYPGGVGESRQLPSPGDR